MTVYCFDTDILAAALLREPPMQLVRRLARTPGDEQCTTAVSIAEIAYAATRNGDQEMTGRIRELISAATTVLPFDHAAAEVYGTLRGQLERLGVRLDEPSLRIAAIALAHDLTLVTASSRLYDRVPGLRIENWLEPDDAELETSADEDDEAAAEPSGEATPADGVVIHPGLVPSLEARARSLAGSDAGTESDEAAAEAL
ncbi:MAG TPA: PIN domain-containing protein [Gaiella sp.]|jgi:tRNA(fMet)-specific endonuclease VapC